MIDSDAVYGAWDVPGALLVFPSEVVAAEWRTRLAQRSGAVRADAIISWDAFKQMAIPRRERRRPATRAVRLAVARSLLTSGAPELAAIVGTGGAEAGAAVAGGVARALPLLPSILDRMGAARPDLAAAYRYLLEAYRELLTRHDLYEPGWVEPRPDDEFLRSRRVTVFRPELLEDGARLRAILGDAVAWASGGRPANPVIAAFTSARREADAAIEMIARLLDGGVEPEEIAVTLAAIDVQRDTLRDAALRRGVPLREASGRPLLEIPGGVIFERIHDAIGRGLDVRGVAALVLDQSVPWREPAELRDLVRFGYATHCHSDAEWERAFDLAFRALDMERSRGRVADLSRGRLAVVRKRWSRLRTGFRALAGSRTVTDLSAALTRFTGDQFEARTSARWEAHDGTAARAWERVRTEVESARSLDALAGGTDPWRLLRDLLAEVRYVPRTGGAAVAVYPYRVAAALPVAHHFILGASRSATVVRDVPPPRLTRRDLDAIGWESGDRTAAYLAAYSEAGTRLSFAAQGIDGAHVAPSGFVIEPADAAAPPRELGWWAGEPGAPPPISPAARRGVRRRLERARRQEHPLDLRRHTVGDGTLRTLLAARRTPIALFDHLAECPFSALVRDLLGAGDPPWRFDPHPSRALGMALHAAINAVLDRLAEERPVDADGAALTTHEDLESHLAPLADAAIDAAFADPEILVAFPRHAIDSYRRVYARVIVRLIAALPETLGVGRRGRTEHDVVLPIGEHRISGRIDRLLGIEGGEITILDFKSTSHGVPSLVAALGGKGAPYDVAAIRSHQPLVYAAAVATEAERPIDRLVFVDIRGATEREYPSRRKGAEEADDALAELVEALPDHLEAQLERIAAGDVRCTAAGTCTCGVREICRSCFHAATTGEA